MKKDIYLIGDVGHFNNHTLNIFNTINQDSLPDDCIILLNDVFNVFVLANVISCVYIDLACFLCYF